MYIPGLCDSQEWLNGNMDPKYENIPTGSQNTGLYEEVVNVLLHYKIQ